MKRYLKNERGSQVIEFVGIFPLILAAALVSWQIMMAAYTFIVCEAAARDAARVASVHGDYEQAAKNTAGALYESSSQVITGDEVKVTVKTKVPSYNIPFFGHYNIPIETSAIMPLEEDDSGP